MTALELSESLLDEQDRTNIYQVNFMAVGLTRLSSSALIWKARPGSVRQVRSVETL